MRRSNDRCFQVGVCLAWVLCAGLAAPAAAAWHGGARRFRVELQTSADGFARGDKVVETTLNLTALLAQAGGSGTVNLSSLKLVEVTSTGALIDAIVPFQFDGQTVGTLVWMLEGLTAAGATRYHELYFDSLAAAPTVFPDQVVVTNNIMDAGQSSYRIASQNGTYYFQKEAAGFSSLVDIHGNDWLSFDPTPGSGSAGEYRGTPNLVFPANIYHPGFTSASSTLIHDGPIKATVESPSDNGLFRTRWDFYPEFARLTVLEASGNYWFLYEGTPGGVLDRTAPNNDFLVRSDGSVFSVADTWGNSGQDIPGDEWVYFADPIVEKSIFVAHHTNDAVVDWYSPLDLPAGGPDSDWMTVFGFGRGSGASSNLSGTGRQFTIGLLDTIDFGTAEAEIRSAYKPLTVTVGTPEDDSECGDDIISGTEQCDDGNVANGDGCDSNCVIEDCGNGVVQAGETCDDGNTNDIDACGNDCTLNFCGDGEVNNGEACDDQGTTNGDGCDSQCRLEVCGNGIVQTGEQCDDGNMNDIDACGNDCALNICGDGQVNNGEQCDDGNGSNSDGCRNNCQLPRCGDGVIDAGEQCDDGNADDLDSCGNDCLANYCGDGVRNNGELCDDGNTVDDDLCSNDCLVAIQCDSPVVNGDFAAGTANWTFFKDSTAAFTVVTGEAKLQITTVGTNVQLYQNPVAVQPDTLYRLTFRGRNTAGSDVDVRLQRHDAPYESFGVAQRVNLTTAMQRFVLLFTTPAGNLSNGRLMFHVGNYDVANSQYYFDDIRLERADDCPLCGDTLVGIGEDCDDGNVVDTDGCPNDCRFPACGDGSVDPGEECDDGNTTSGDGCSSGCAIENCGDGSRQDPEECDDGNTAPGDGCDSDCLIEVCGNGVVQAGEQCDDGNTAPGDGCDESCATEACGNGVLQPGEECDDGNNAPGDGCDPACVLEVCGNGRLQAGEQCDDDNTVSGDGCDSQCRLEVCGNAFVQAGEQCDDGNVVNGDGCSSQCRLEVCGDGTAQSSEQCDDGNIANGDGCDSQCRLEVCGNGIVQAGEQCDDGNTNDNDGCHNDCKVPGCGDGRPDAGEQCDDGNTNDTDACGNDCVQNFCGDGQVNNGEQCDDANANNDDACRNNCTINTCGPTDSDHDGVNDGCDPDDDNDGVFDWLDCAPFDASASKPPTEVTGVSVVVSDQTYLNWTSMGPAYTYDVVRGNLSDLLSQGHTNAALCLVTQTSATSFAIPGANPTAGQGRYYLVRAWNVCGPGTWGTNSDGIPREPTDCD